jgi:hypothetical protein
VFDFGYASEAEQNSFLLSVVALVGSWLGGKHNQLWKSYKSSFSCHKLISDRNWDPEIEMHSISLSVTCLSFLVNFFLCPFGGWSKYYSYGS